MSLGINLHSIVRGAISALHPDDTVTLYQSAGQQNVKGEIKPVYDAPQSVTAQIQSESDEKLYHADRVGQNDVTRRFYLFADPAKRPAGVIRPLARGGDIIQRTDGTWWLVVAVPEDFSAAGWTQVRCSLQAKAPDFSASPWWDGGTA